MFCCIVIMYIRAFIYSTSGSLLNPNKIIKLIIAAGHQSNLFPNNDVPCGAMLITIKNVVASIGSIWNRNSIYYGDKLPTVSTTILFIIL